MKALKKNIYGFTLIELMVVIGIIAILTTVGITAYGQVTKGARITKRSEDLQSLSKALEVYKAVNKKYPINDVLGGVCIDQATTGISEIVPEYLPSLPTDPSKGTNCYKYLSDVNGKGYKLYTSVASSEMSASDFNARPSLVDPARDDNPATCNVETGNSVSAWAVFRGNNSCIWTNDSTVVLADGGEGGDGDPPPPPPDPTPTPTLAPTATPTPTPIPGLTAQWKMNEASWTSDCVALTVLDSTASNIRGKACPAGSGLTTSGTDFKFGRAGLFDKANNYLDFGNPASLNSITNGTVAFWFKKPAPLASGRTTIIAKDNAGTNSGDFAVHILDSGNPKIEFQLANTTPADILIKSNSNVVTDSWIHVAVTFGSGGMKMFVNGVQQTETSSNTNTWNSTATFFIGSRRVNLEPFAGIVDDVRVYSRALSASEIGTVMSGE